MMMKQQIDKKGRLALPRELWAQIGIFVGEEAELFEQNGAIVIRRRLRCRCCGGMERVDPVEQLCRDCARMYCMQLRLHTMPG